MNLDGQHHLPEVNLSIQQGQYLTPCEDNASKFPGAADGWFAVLNKKAFAKATSEVNEIS